MKKLLMAVAVAGLVGTVNAQSAFKGFYGQVGIGYEQSSSSFTGGSVSGAGYRVNANNSNAFTGGVGIGGYFPLTSNFLLGVGAVYSPIASSSSNFTLSIAGVGDIVGSYKKKDSYNIFLSPAFVIDKDKLAYAKIGYTGTNVQTTAAGASETKSYTGYSLGLGYRQVIQGGFYGFGEVNYAAYSSQSDGGGFSGSSKPTAINVMFGVGYKF